jgi:DNA-binding transcriptional LysR family regulator
MDLHYLEIFNTVATFESYKKASAVLHISQPALSVQIKRLESQIGLKLFDKRGNKVYLSENGIMLFSYTKKIFRIVSDLEDAISDTQGYVGGTLNLGGSNTPGSYVLPELIGAYKKQYPKVIMNLSIGNTADIAHYINNGTLDVAINGGTCNYNEHIYVEELFSDKLILVASPQSSYCDIHKITASKLKDMSFVVHKTDSQLYSFYDKFIHQMDIPENVIMSLGNIDAIKKAVAANIGVSLIPYSAVKFELQFGILRQLNLPDLKLRYPYSLIYNKSKPLSAASKKYIEFTRKYIGDYANN